MNDYIELLHSCRFILSFYTVLCILVYWFFFSDVLKIFCDLASWIKNLFKKEEK